MLHKDNIDFANEINKELRIITDKINEKIDSMDSFEDIDKGYLREIRNENNKTLQFIYDLELRGVI